jgi:MFS family permease
MSDENGLNSCEGAVLRGKLTQNAKTRLYASAVGSGLVTSFVSGLTHSPSWSFFACIVSSVVITLLIGGETVNGDLKTAYQYLRTRGSVFKLLSAVILLGVLGLIWCVFLYPRTWGVGFFIGLLVLLVALRIFRKPRRYPSSEKGMKLY